MKVKNNFLLKALSILSLGIIPIVPLSTSAAILFNDPSTTGITQANNFWYNNPFSRDQSNTSILGFNEAQNVVLTRNIGVQEIPATLGNDWENLVLDNIIAAGTTVSSHMIYLSKNATPTGRINLTADIVFDNIILGFVGDFCLFSGNTASGCVSSDNITVVTNNDNDLFAPGASNIGPGTAQSLEGVTQAILTQDIVTMLDPKSIRVNFSQNSGIDPLRVITLVPDDIPFEFSPGLGILSLMGLGGIQYFYKKSTNNKN